MLVVWWYSLRTIHWTLHSYEPALLQPCIEAQAGATEKHLTWDILGRDNGGLHLRDIASEYGRRGPCSGWYAQIERNPFHHVLQVWMASGYLWFKEETSLSTERTPSALIHCVAHSGSFIQLPPIITAKHCLRSTVAIPSLCLSSIPACVSPAVFSSLTLQAMRMPSHRPLGLSSPWLLSSERSLRVWSHKTALRGTARPLRALLRLPE